MSPLSDVPDALENATIRMILGEVVETTKKRTAEGNNVIGIMASKPIEFKKWRAPWLTENHVYYYKEKLQQAKADKSKLLVPLLEHRRGATILTPCTLSKDLDSGSSCQRKRTQEIQFQQRLCYQ
jgi:hypothetical protein